MMVTRAFADPIAISGNDTGFATCAAIALCATAGPAIGSDSAAATSQASVSARAVVSRKPLTGAPDRRIFAGAGPYWAVAPVLVFCFAGVFGASGARTAPQGSVGPLSGMFLSELL